MEKGLVPLSKNDIVGRDISFSYGILLFAEPPRRSFIQYHEWKSNSDNTKRWEEEDGNFVIDSVEPGQKLKLLDFFYRLDEDRYEIMPWLKLRTEDGIEGWVRTNDW